VGGIHNHYHHRHFFKTDSIIVIADVDCLSTAPFYQYFVVVHHSTSSTTIEMG
jgi:hypothetical protein